MKKIFLFISLILSVALLFGGCRKTEDSKPDQSENPGQTVSMPTLPDLDFTDMDFFDDGYEIVE